jgi:hypothetical protein
MRANQLLPIVALCGVAGAGPTWTPPPKTSPPKTPPAITTTTDAEFVMLVPRSDAPEAAAKADLTPVLKRCEAFGYSGMTAEVVSLEQRPAIQLTSPASINDEMRARLSCLFAFQGASPSIFVKRELSPAEQVQFGKPGVAIKSDNPVETIHNMKAPTGAQWLPRILLPDSDAQPWNGADYILRDVRPVIVIENSKLFASSALRWIKSGAIEIHELEAARLQKLTNQKYGFPEVFLVIDGYAVGEGRINTNYGGVDNDGKGYVRWPAAISTSSVTVSLFMTAIEYPLPYPLTLVPKPQANPSGPATTPPRTPIRKP